MSQTDGDATEMRKSKIRTTLEAGEHGENLKLGGWLDGSRSYLWVGTEKRCMGILSGYKLYRLAQAIVKHWEADENKV